MLDADVVIAGERGVFNLEDWLTSRGGETFCLAAVTVAELLHGLERATPPHRARREAFLSRLLSGCEVLPYTRSTAAIHARIWAALEASGQMAGAHDLLVAATALENDLPVATFNTRHFRSIEGLRIIEP